MKKKIVVSKGYTIEVTSWENDGDNYLTRRKVVDDKEYAIALLDMCKAIFTIDGGIGNMIGEEVDKAPEIILNYLADKPIITKQAVTPNDIVDLVMDLNYDLMGCSDYYYSRVFEKGVVYYSPEDILVEKIA